ncbi:MAG: anhydro-N-acetylmuramic acid kinase [Candidatus Omnitrophica bacterium]|nr:anhydro-N-acetylmuramic acid kinase [Candidatus Omnitrophota bacterium]
MSGTSCDGVSAALVEFHHRAFRVAAFRTDPYPAPVRALLQRAGELTAPQLAQVNILLGELLADSALQVLRAGRALHGARHSLASEDGAGSVGRVSLQRVAVVGSHGHTVYHGPRDPIPSTLELGDPSLIAERTGLPVVADFRMRDLAAGGEGAPLVPFFDQYFFGRGAARALQNIGGIANVAIVGRRVTPLAFDTGPGNGLMDTAARRITAGRQSFDSGGGLARQGRVDEAALKRLLAHPYFRRPPPKSTGPELFNASLLAEAFGRRWWRRGLDVLATVTYFTACTIADSYRRFVRAPIREVIVSGGGVKNRTLMAHLTRLLAPVPVYSIARYGLDPQAKEPVAFAFLALRAIQGRSNHLPHTTGARGPRPLGILVSA